MSSLLIRLFFFFFSSRRRHTRYWRDWSSDVCSSDLCQFHLGRSHVFLPSSLREVYQMPSEIGIFSRFFFWCVFITGPHNCYFFMSSVRTVDRKSTRLNSSHANISYAVFCLKKKTISSYSFSLDIRR